MKKYLFGLLLVLASCSNSPVHQYTCKVHYKDGTNDTIVIVSNDIPEVEHDILDGYRVIYRYDARFREIADITRLKIIKIK